MQNVDTTQAAQHGRMLLRLGMLLFLLGLLTGFSVYWLAAPRLALSAHLIALMQGVFLFALGLAWSKLRLGHRSSVLGLCLAAYGAYAGWATNLLASAWGAGGMLPLAGGGAHGSPIQETVIWVGLRTVALALIALCLLVLWGLRGSPATASRPDA